MIYLDSSAIVKLVRREPGSVALHDYLAGNDGRPQTTSDVSMVEVPRAVAQGEPLALPAAYQVLGRMTRVPADPSVLMSAASLPPLRLRSLDAIHLASALAVRRHLTGFVSYDTRLIEAARHHDLPAEMPT